MRLAAPVRHFGTAGPRRHDHPEHQYRPGKGHGLLGSLTGSVIYTHYQIQVSEQFKGATRNSVEVMTPGGTVKALHQSFSGSPVLNQGDEFVFFLWTSKGGITWITGLTQGLFSLAGEPGTDL